MKMGVEAAPVRAAKATIYPLIQTEITLLKGIFAVTIVIAMEAAVLLWRLL
jgi:hypothetical protein